MSMTQAERDAQDAASLEKQLSAHPAIYRDKLLYEGVTVGGVTIGTDDQTQLRLAGARIAADADSNYSVKWKTPSGFVDLNATQIIAISDAVREHIQKCFDAEAVVEAGTYATIELLEAAFDTAYTAA